MSSNPASPNEGREDEACLYAMLLCTSQVFPSVLNASIELNLFDIIANATPHGGTVSASQIASKLPNQYPGLPNRLERMLRLLASYSLLTCSPHTNQDGSIERFFGISAVGKYFVSDEERGCASAIANFLNYPAMSQLWPKYKEVILNAEEDDLFKKVHGISLFEYRKKDETMKSIFNKSMANICTINMNRILEVYKGFEGVPTLVDVGGCTGQNLRMIISKYPTIKGVNFDLPQVVEQAPAYPGIQHVGGDMFTYVPQGDAIILQSVLHNWSDEQCISLLRNCHNALPQDGRVIIIEFVTEEATESNASKLVAVLDNLMYITNSGKERTVKEYEALCKLSGFSRFHVACRAFFTMGVFEFHK
ncbi:isoliquiritigenin 2'-O-methyltransferase-like [Abrus precatorius]|uniref:Isoliquiritigenin 2'-O-methyltransferase-like n=1 Tax=Abrus precatorius TaxID=3816 RepID=A0A8B8M823_ABRPR|nr:isoliquiritigenin 2'-O-methyltransferase-like [Abrus precatorius]